MGTQSAAPALYPNLKYDPAKSFAQIGIVNYTPQAIVSKKALTTTNLKDFIAYVKANGSKISYGHAGVGSISHVAGLVFNAKFGLTPNLIPYRGTGPVLQDMVAGQIDYTVDQSLNVIPQIKAGTIKAYAVAAPERLSSIPDVPTTKEAGDDFIFSAWNAMVAPKDTPRDIVEQARRRAQQGARRSGGEGALCRTWQFRPAGRGPRPGRLAEARRKRGRAHHAGDQGCGRDGGIAARSSRSWPSGQSRSIPCADSAPAVKTRVRARRAPE